MTSRSTTALCLLSLLSISCSSLASAPIAPQSPSITYKEIGDPLIAAIGFIDDGKNDLTEQERSKILQDVPQFNEGEKLKAAFEILEAASQSNNTASTIPAVSHQAMRSTIKELEVFFCQGADSKNHLFSKINHTKTIIGQAAFAKMLIDPIDNIQSIRNRQALVQELLNNKQLFSQLDSMLSHLANKESDMLSFWQKKNPFSMQNIAGLYIPVGSLNFNSTALNAWRTFINVYSIISLAPMALYTIQAAKVTKAYAQLAYNQDSTPETKKQLVLNIDEAKKRYKALGMLTAKKKELLNKHNSELTTSPEKLNSEYIDLKKYSTLTTYANALGTGSLGALSGLMAAMQVMRIKRDNTTLRYMQTRLSGIATLLKTAHEFNTIVAKNNSAIHGLFMQHLGIEHLEQQAQKIENLKKLIGLLETGTLTGNYSFFSNSGRILAAFSLIQTLKNEFVGLMQAVGEVDACLSIAKLYMSLQENSNATYCFVDYVEQNTPYLHLEDFWNPIIDPSIVVTNSIEPGGAQSPRNIVVTGSNTGGKSTILKAVVANIMLSRLGIAPARVAVMTPFTYLATSMNIGDDTAGGVSLFKAEVLRAKSILSNVKSLQPNQFAFLAIDELFVGTASEKGEEAACKFAETLNALPNTMFTFATHFKKATTLEQRTNGTCKNYMVEAYKDETGTIVRPFKLEAGISTSNIANDILQENISSIDFLESSVEALA